MSTTTKRWAMGAALALLIGVGLTPGSQPASATTGSVTVVAGGDIACATSNTNYNGGAGQPTSCQMGTTANLVKSIAPQRVFALGDLQYETGALSEFNVAYQNSWGAFKSITSPVVGNHEYGTSGASGYYTYWGSAAAPSKGYYSYDIPVGTSKWHVVVLNSECASTNGGVGCAVGSPQYNWLQSDLTTNAGTVCTAVLMHRPRWASDAQASSAISPLVDLMYQHRVDLMLTGHAHNYERFAPQDSNGNATADGIRQFIVGTGGKDFGSFGTIAPNSQVQAARKFGVLKLDLSPTGYNWNFVASAATPFTDTGSGSCNGQQDTTPPSTPTNLATSSAPTSSSVPLTWSASTDNTGVAGYRVYRSDISGPLNSSLVSSPSYTDTTVAPSTSYSYTVTAVDGTGNESARSSPLAVTTPAASSGSSGSTLTFAPTDDATVDSSQPTVNFGSSNRLTVDSSALTDSLLKFAVVGTQGCTVASAKLRLTVGSTTYDDSTYGGDVYGVADNSWSESTVTWNTKPAAGTTKVGSIATSVALNSTHTVDVTPLVTGDGTVSMLLGSSNSNGARYWSKDGSTAAQAPQLQVTCGTGTSTPPPTSDTTAPTAPGGFTATAASSSQVNLAWSASTDAVGVTGYRVYRNGGTTPLASLGSASRSYSDNTVAASTSYTYEVSAVDAAGNESTKSSASVTTPAASTGSSTLNFAPTDDATVDSAQPSVNFGSSNRLSVDSSTAADSLLKFAVTGTAGCTVTSAKLRLTVGSTTYDDSTYGGDVYGVADNSWSESTVTWNTKPAAGTTKVGSIATSVALNTTYTVNVTPLVTGDGTVSMLLGSSNSNGAHYWSKEGSTPAQAPQLQVTCG